MLARRRINLAMMSAIAMIGMCSPGAAACGFSQLADEPSNPHDVPPLDPPKPLGPPPLTPEQIKAQEKRARRVAKRAP